MKKTMYFVVSPGGPLPLKGLCVVVLVYTEVGQLCSDLPKQIVPRRKNKPDSF